MSRLGFRTSLFGFCRAQVLDYIDKQSADFQKNCEELKDQCDQKLRLSEAEHKTQIDELNTRIAEIDRQKSESDERCRRLEEENIKGHLKIEELEGKLSRSDDRIKQLEAQVAAVADENSRLLGKLKDYILRSDFPETENARGDMIGSPIYRYENTVRRERETNPADILFETVKNELSGALEAIAGKIRSVQKDADNMDLTGN